MVEYNFKKEELQRWILGITSWLCNLSFWRAGWVTGGAWSAELLLLTMLQCTIGIGNYYDCYDWNCSVMHQVLLNSGCCICLLISGHNYLVSAKGSGWGPIAEHQYCLIFRGSEQSPIPWKTKMEDKLQITIWYQQRDRIAVTCYAFFPFQTFGIGLFVFTWYASKYNFSF